MSTHARIGIANPDGSVKSIYVGSDGYLSWTGTRLLNHFNTPNKVRKLISMGALRIIGKEIGEKHDAADWGSKHPDWCSFFRRDQDQKDMGASTNPTLGAFVSEEYSYLWKDSQWWLVEEAASGPPFTLTDLRVALVTDRITE